MSKPSTPGSTKNYSSRQFFLDDYPRTLFPLNTNRILVQNGEEIIRRHIAELGRDNKPFLVQQQVYAAKDAYHYRRTFKLDPVAEFFIYDLVYRNRARFRKPHKHERMHFGYRFEGGEPIAASVSYKAFKEDLLTSGEICSNSIGFDIANYFNHIYHHDLVEWFEARGANEADVNIFGKFLREINAGRSLDCLPQGLYPTKMIGNDFLRFIEESHSIRSKYLSRFMDDFYIFSDKKADLRADFAEVQRLLGQKGLSINAAKTLIDKPTIEKSETELESPKDRLLKLRRAIVATSLYDEDIVIDEGDADRELSDEEIEYVKSILQNDEVDAHDAELILTVMGQHTDVVFDYLPGIMERFPHLSKNIHLFCSEVEDKEAVADMLLALVQNSTIQEYQLFWLASTLEDQLLETNKASSLINDIVNHPNATDISKAKVLEIADARFGLLELREKYLRKGQSDWLSWSSAVGSRSMKTSSRNY